MKTIKLLLCLFVVFFTTDMSAKSQGNIKKIRLENITNSSTTEKGKRSVSFLDASAFFDFDTESVLISFHRKAINAEISVINLLTNEVVYTENFFISESLVLNTSGLLNEGEVYRLEITIEDTVLYGDFSL